MNLDLSEDQTLLCDTVARVFAENSTPAGVRKTDTTRGFDRSLWNTALRLGLVTLRRDGNGSLLDAALVAESAGRHLASIPLVEATIGWGLLERAGADIRLLERLAAGDVISMALQPVVPGRPPVVPFGAEAGTLLYKCGGELIALERTIAPLSLTVSQSQQYALVDLCAIEGKRTVLAAGQLAQSLFEAAIEEWKVLSAAWLAGAARRALELAGAYSCERIQFGRPIGAFQGVAHPLADSITAIDGARLLAHRAIWAISERRADAAQCVSIAWAWAAQAADQALVRAVRAFGGYGVTLEYDVQLYYRRCKTVALSLGGFNTALDEVADRALDGGSVTLPSAGDVEIDFGLGASAEAYAVELRSFVAANITSEIAEKIHYSTSGHHPGFHKKLASAGYAFPDLAAAMGGPERSRYHLMAAAALWEDIGWTRVPSAVTEMVGKLALMWSQPDAKAEILSRIISGDALCALGFSEPNAGSDVFATSLSAVQTDAGWVLNGQKMFTTNAHNADYIILLTRTHKSPKKHEGLTVFIMPLRLPGVQIQAVHTLQDERTNIVFFGDVLVPDRYRAGEIGAGAKVMASALQIEQGGADYHYAQLATLRRALVWARRQGIDGNSPIGRTEVRRVLAQATMRTLVGEVLCRRALWGAIESSYQPSWGPMAKLFTTEALLADATAIVDLAAPEVLIRGIDKDLDVVESMMRRAIAMTIYGGTSEIHRSIIAEQALGMPKSRS
jgi:3-oxochol-4-en-24-oyl-CoA dehydrogenase